MTPCWNLKARVVVPWSKWILTSPSPLVNGLKNSTGYQRLINKKRENELDITSKRNWNNSCFLIGKSIRYCSLSCFLREVNDTNIYVDHGDMIMSCSFSIRFLITGEKKRQQIFVPPLWIEFWLIQQPGLPLYIFSLLTET